MKAKVIDREEVMTELKDEERLLRKINDDLHKENRQLSKANKGLQDKNEDYIKAISGKRTTLKNLNEKGLSSNESSVVTLIILRNAGTSLFVTVQVAFCPVPSIT